MRNHTIITIENNLKFKKGSCKKIHQSSRIHGKVFFNNIIVNYTIPEKRNGVKLKKSKIYFADNLSALLSKPFVLDGCAMIFDFGVVIPSYGGFLIQDSISKNVIRVGNISSLVAFSENATTATVNNMFEVKWRITN